MPHLCMHPDGVTCLAIGPLYLHMHYPKILALVIVDDFQIDGVCGLVSMDPNCMLKIIVSKNVETCVILKQAFVI